MVVKQEIGNSNEAWTLTLITFIYPKLRYFSGYVSFLLKYVDVSLSG